MEGLFVFLFNLAVVGFFIDDENLIIQQLHEILRILHFFKHMEQKLLRRVPFCGRNRFQDQRVRGIRRRAVAQKIFDRFKPLIAHLRPVGRDVDDVIHSSVFGAQFHKIVEREAQRIIVGQRRSGRFIAAQHSFQQGFPALFANQDILKACCHIQRILDADETQAFIRIER